MDFVQTQKAKKAREEMKQCPRSCGWYQYFATDVFASPFSLVSSLRPYLYK
jgi:hypothetical protein